MPEESEARILAAFHQPANVPAPWGQLFRKTSCAVASVHGMADYNGHFGIRELCDICPLAQLQLCKDAWQAPDLEVITRQARALGATGPVEITDRAILVEGLDEHPRYFLQHGFGYQVHDRRHPHHPRRHGRADIGWPQKDTA
ncbi:hypothetical protein [Streptomyces fildesensis]|uniref:hypothetical protein n=1 Tax=Streptomyces fildesensis TaxID=375757 RepID=UPI001E486583|nr:hypothetical protein [Streptomyces fildesensis]